MDKQELKSKFMGALIGTAVGDSLGAPFEGNRNISPELVDIMIERLPVLTYTDDTHMMIGVAESLIKNGGFNGEDMAMAFVRNYDLEPHRGYGPGPPRIFRLLKAGAAWDEAARGLYGGGSYGNGSAMRIALVGVFYHDNPEMLREVAYQSSRITHSHQLGKDGAALQGYAIALAVQLHPNGIFNTGGFLAGLVSYMPEGVYRGKLDTVQALLDQPDDYRVITELGNGIEAFNSVPTAVYSFLSHNSSFRQAVLYAVSLGGDADTIGAMTGAISGAYSGLESIPVEWRDKLENRLYIEELAEELWLGFINMR